MSKTAAGSWQTTIREVYVEPLLPPPIIQSIRTVDDTINEYVGVPEATITILVTLFVAWTLYQFIGWWMTYNNNNQQRRAIKLNKKSKSDIDDVNQKEQQRYDATVLFTGPRNSGKTRLFYQFMQCHTTDVVAGTGSTAFTTSSPILTVMSLQTNIDYITVATNKTESSHNSNSSTVSSTSTDQQEGDQHPKYDQPQIIRLIDYPGHASVYDSTYIQIITPLITRMGNNKKVSSSSPPLRIVVVVDATQPVTVAAELLFQLFTILHDSYINPPNYNSKKSSIPTQNKPCIFVACHKKDILKKAKNEKRIKIQIRTELERLIYHHSVLQTTTALNNNNSNEDNTSSGNSSKATTSSTGNSGWWCCPPPPPQSSTGHSQTTSMNNNNNQTSSINPFTIAVDFDELPFVQVFFYATTCCEDTISRELFEFCTTGTVKSSY